MGEEDSNYYLVQIQKWGILGMIFAAIIFIIMKTVKMDQITFDNNDQSKYMWIFAGISYLVVLIGSLVRDAMTDDDSKGESFMDFLPNLVITVLWYVYMGIALGYKLLDPGGKPGGKRGGSRPGDVNRLGISRTDDGSIGITLGAATEKIKILMYMGISITLINVISNLYVYYNCKESGCSGDEETLTTSLVGAQYNIILIGLAAIVMFIVDHRN